MKRFLFLFLMAAWLMGTVPCANASLVMTLDDVATAGIDVIVADALGAGATSSGGFLTTDADGSPTSGVVFFMGPVGGFNVNITTGLSKPAIGDLYEALLDLNSVNVSGARGGTLDIWLTDTDFLVAGQPRSTRLVSEIGGTTQGSVSFQQILDLDNYEFATGSGDFVYVDQGPFTGAFSSTTSRPVDLGADPFSLTEKVRITHTAGGQITSFDAISSVPVPEPATMLLLGAGLVCFGVVGRKKLFKSL